MTNEQANATAELFLKIGGFHKIEVEEFGWRSGNFLVNLWSINAKAGNRTLETVNHPVDEKEAKMIARAAKGKATARDKEALGRMAAERQMNRE